MPWKISEGGTLNAAGLPMRHLQQSVMAEWQGKDEIELCSVRYHASIESVQVTWPQTHVTVGPDRLSRGETAYFSLTFPFDLSLIRRIEDWRLGRGDNVNIQVRMELYFRRVNHYPLPAPPKQVIAAPKPQGFYLPEPVKERFRELSAPEHESGYLSISINRDRWITILQAVGWNEYEIFELPTSRLKSVDRLAEGLKHLQMAQTAFRQGQWSVTAVEARRACEAAAGVGGTETDRKKLFDSLLVEIVPDEHDKPKRDMLSGMMTALTPLRNQGAHANIRMAVERADAELSLTAAIAIFRYFGEALASAGRPAV